MKRYWSEICAALFLAVVINCFGGVIVYASSAEQQITDQMELTDLQSMVDEMLGEKTFSVTEAFHRLLSGEEVLSEESVREFLHSLLFYGIEREKELIVKLLLLLLFAAVFSGFAGAFDNGQVGEISFYVVYLLVFTLLMNSFSGLSASLLSMLAWITEFMKELSPVYFMAVAAASGASSAAAFYQGVLLISLMTGTGGIMGGIKSIATAIGPGGVFVLAVGACIAIGVLLYKNWDKIKEMAGKVWDWISNKTRRFVENIGNKLRGLATKMTTIWGNIKASAHQKWNAIWSTVSGFAERIKNAIVDKFTSVKNTVVDVFNGMRDAIRSVLNNIISVVNGAISKVNGVVSAIESAFSFGPWKVPTPFGSKTIGFKATFPRVPTVPYLAKGAVIPPRSEFLAVLGDQKQGNNIETPEALLRKIVREETAGRQTGGGSYRFTAQINRRTLFDEMMKEAQMRRDTSGRNPFEMA